MTRKRKSISQWWQMLTGAYVWLWRNNLLYLTCVLPSVICGFLFLNFHAYAFLIIAAILFIPAGPAILAAQETAMTALEQTSSEKTPFFTAYRKNLKCGTYLGCALSVLSVIVGLPPYFARQINSPFLGPVVFGCCISLLLWFSCSTHLFSQLRATKSIDITKLLHDVFSLGILCPLFAVVKLIWILICLFAPPFGAACALVGVPAIIRFSNLFFEFCEGDTDE